MRPAAPVRLGRGGEPPGLISPSGVFPCSRARQAPAPGSMLDPHDDTDVPSGSTDGAQMESTSFPVLREHGDHRQEDEGSPVPTSSSSAPTAARTLDTAATEESSFTVEAATPAARLQSPTPPSARPEARGTERKPPFEQRNRALADEPKCQFSTCALYPKPARGPGRGPTVVWAQPGCWGFLSPKLQSEELVGLESVTLC